MIKHLIDCSHSIHVYQVDKLKINPFLITAKLVNLSPADRENETLVESTVSVRINNDFLKSGVKVIDSPGRNENKVLDNMVIDHLKTILPLIVYVIDGKNLLTTQVGLIPVWVD
jgi:hypothetical protein